jgi:hypothetical protein
MGRPLNKRFFAKADAGPTVAGNEIQVRFYDGAPGAEGFIVKQRGTRKFVVSTTGDVDKTYDCVLVAGVEPNLLTFGQMLIFAKADDGETYTVSKIAGRRATLVKNDIGDNIYDGKSVPWNFSADLTDGFVQIEEAGGDDVAGGGDDFTETAANVPDKITNLTVSSYGSGGQDSLLINYTPPNDNGFAITEYIVFANGVEMDSYGTVIRPITQTGLTAGTTYAIQVQAVNSQGVGELSDAVNGTTNEAEPPVKITGVTSEVLSSSSIRINFTAPYDSGSAITGYIVYMNGFEHGNFVGSVPPLTITGLTAATSYSIHVKAVNSIGSGQLSDPISAVTDTEAEG